MVYSYSLYSLSLSSTKGVSYCWPQHSLRSRATVSFPTSAVKSNSCLNWSCGGRADVWRVASNCTVDLCSAWDHNKALRESIWDPRLALWRRFPSPRVHGRPQTPKISVHPHLTSHAQQLQGEGYCSHLQSKTGKKMKEVVTVVIQPCHLTSPHHPYLAGIPRVHVEKTFHIRKLNLHRHLS